MNDVKDGFHNMNTDHQLKIHLIFLKIKNVLEEGPQGSPASVFPEISHPRQFDLAISYLLVFCVMLHVLP